MGSTELVPQQTSNEPPSSSRAGEELAVMVALGRVKRDRAPFEGPDRQALAESDGFRQVVTARALA
jgi:hypothetical protein